MKNRKWPALVVCLLFVVLPAMLDQTRTSAAGLWYVSTTGSYSYDCASPATACASIEAAVSKSTFLAGDTVRVAAGTYTGVGSQVVWLWKDAIVSGGWDAGFTSQNGMSIIDGQNTRRGVWVDHANTTIDHLIIQNGRPGIIGSGNLTVTNSIITGNQGNNGGGIALDGLLTLIDSTVSRNYASSSGGGIFFYGGLNTIELIVKNSTIYGNKAAEGGGVYGVGQAIFENSTISTNATGDGGKGGGLYLMAGQMNIYNSTITANTAQGGGGSYIFNGSINLRNSILAGNRVVGGFPDISMDIYADGYHSMGYNLIGDPNFCVGNIAYCQWPATQGDLVNVDPKLGPLQDNSGSTLTHALLSGSPALNSANPSGCYGSTGILTTDQRGLPRWNRCDIGAFEGQALSSTMKTVSHPSASIGDSLAYTISINNGSGSAIAGVRVTDTLPASLLYSSGSLAATGGSVAYANGTITWQGSVGAGSTVNITFRATVGPALYYVTNSATIAGGGEIFPRSATTIVDTSFCRVNKNSGNPVLAPGAAGAWDDSSVLYPTVLKEGPTYKMWYTGVSSGGSRGIGYATSEDGLYWVKHPGNPVLLPSQSWEGTRVFASNVIAETGMYKMWYVGADSNGVTRIGYATSSDGVAWVKHSGNPVMDIGMTNTWNGDEWDHERITTPSVLEIGDTYHLWYSGSDGLSNRIGHATSFDGTNWTKDPGNPILDLGLAGAWDWLNAYAPNITKLDGNYLLWYSGETLPAAAQTGYAISTDGQNWVRRGNVISQGPPSTFDARGADYATSMPTSTGFQIWYSGMNDAGTYSIGNATATLCGANVPTPPCPGNCAYLPYVANSRPPAPCGPYYADNFTDPASGWPISNGANAQSAYVGGEYQILVTSPSWSLGVTPGAIATNFTAAVTARRLTGSGGSYGIIFDLNDDWSRFHEFDIANGSFSLWRHEGGYVPLIAWRSSNYINTGSGSNRLKVIRSGDNISLYANDHLLWDKFNEPWLGGLRRIGIIASSPSSGPVDVRFDDFALSPADCSRGARLDARSNGFQMGRPQTWQGPAAPGYK